MTIEKNEARQNLAVAWVDVELADLTNGTAEDALELPGGAIVVGGQVQVLTAFDSATSDVLDVGDANDPDRYLAGQSIAAAGVFDLSLTGYEHPALEDLQVTWTGAGGGETQGKFRLVVFYIDTGKAEWTQG